VTGQTIENIYAQEKVDTVPFFFRKDQFQLRFYDTEGQEDYDVVRPQTYKSAGIVVICFSIISPSSFSNVKTKWCYEVQRHCPGAMILLVGTKVDLRNNEEFLQRLAERKLTPITKKQGQSLAKELGAVAYLELSVQQQNITEVFTSGIVQLLSTQQNKQSTKKAKANCQLL